MKENKMQGKDMKKRNNEMKYNALVNNKEQENETKEEKGKRGI